MANSSMAVPPLAIPMITPLHILVLKHQQEIDRTPRHHITSTTLMVWRETREGGRGGGREGGREGGEGGREGGKLCFVVPSM